MYYSSYSADGDIIGGIGKLYIGKITIPDNIANRNIANFTVDEAKLFTDYNIDNMENLALSAGGMHLVIDDVSYKPIVTPKGELSTVFTEFKGDGIKLNTGIAEFNMKLYHKYILPYTEYTESKGYSCLSYGNTSVKGYKSFDLMFVQQDKQSGIYYVWLMFNCHSEPRAEFDTDANTVMVYNHTFLINKLPPNKSGVTDRPVFILKIEGEKTNGNT